MSKEIPPIELRTEYNHKKFYFKSRDSFTYDNWVPTLLEVNQSRNYTEQRQSMSAAIIKVAARNNGLEPMPKPGMRCRVGDIYDARFNGQSSSSLLSFLRIQGYKVGYQSPSKDSPHPAFAVFDENQYLDERKPTYHKVVNDPYESLGEIEKNFSLNVIKALAEKLDDIYPGFTLFERLENRGVPVLEDQND
jgi:hypothetical protein